MPPTSSVIRAAVEAALAIGPFGAALLLRDKLAEDPLYGAAGADHSCMSAMHELQAELDGALVLAQALRLDAQAAAVDAARIAAHLAVMAWFEPVVVSAEERAAA